MVDEKRLIYTFFKLVQIDSESKKEQEITDFLKQSLLGLGLEVEQDETGNLIGWKKGVDSKKPALLLSAHMDTVQPGKGIKPQIRDQVIYSDGTTVLGGDDKAGIATILEALEVIKEKKLNHENLEVIFTVSEEIGLIGAKSLNFNKLKSKLGFILDSGGPPGTIIVQAPYHQNLKVKILGKAAHSGVNPEDGINAIQIAGMIIARLPLGRIDSDTTANFGIIKGGRAVNIIPDYVELEGEIRSLDKIKMKKTLDIFRSIFSQVTTEQGAHLEWKDELEYSGFNLSQEDEVVKRAIIAAQSLGIPYKLTSRGGGSDANIFNNEGGIPSINLGIGLTNDHTLEECLAVKDLVTAAEYLLEIITGVAG